MNHPAPGHASVLSAVRWLGALAAGCLVASPLFARAQEPQMSAQEFTEFLEYLGSWDGAEEEWVQFLPDGDVAALTQPLVEAGEADAGDPNRADL
jgi:hypothetical protein